MKSISALMFVLPLVAMADESDIKLKDGPGIDAVKSHCAVCHSLDYIVMNSRFIDQGGWEKELDKMINVMGAPVSAEQRAVILQYLTANYGN